MNFQKCAIMSGFHKSSHIFGVYLSITCIAGGKNGKENKEILKTVVAQ